MLLWRPLKQYQVFLVPSFGSLRLWSRQGIHPISPGALLLVTKYHPQTEESSRLTSVGMSSTLNLACLLCGGLRLLSRKDKTHDYHSNPLVIVVSPIRLLSRQDMEHYSHSNPLVILFSPKQIRGGWVSPCLRQSWHFCPRHTSVNSRVSVSLPIRPRTGWDDNSPEHCNRHGFVHIREVLQEKYLNHRSY